MTVGVGASGYVGIARETTPKTYVAPEKYIPLRSEGMGYMQDTVWRRVLNKTPDIKGPVPGFVHVEGDLECDITEDTLPYLLLGARGTLVKSGTTPNWIYTFTPNNLATPAKTLSVTVVRNGVAFGYVGCVVGSMEFTVEDAMLVGTFSMVGSDEANQTVPTLTFPDTAPFGAGDYSIQIPTATQIFDTDTFTFQIEDNAEPQNRLSTSRGAQFIKYGERSVTLSVERDFESRTEYDNYKALTSQSITLLATKGANNKIAFTTPAAIADSYEISGLSGQGDLIRASIAYNGVYDPTTSKPYEIVINTQETITLP